MIKRFMKQQRQDGEFMLGGRAVTVPKITIEKLKVVSSRIESLPQIIIQALSKRGTDEFTPTVIVGVTLVLDELVNIVAALADLESEWVEKNVGIDEMIEYIRLTAEKNDFSNIVKNFRGILGNSGGV
jgi:hypothetical protein